MNIVLGITGSIAAYKSCTLIRQFIKQGHEVQVVITPAGKEFITPITLSALTSKPVVSEFFSQRDGTWHSHVTLGLWADAMVIAPASANTLAKMAHGIADNMLLTTYLSMKAPVFVAPAMDLDMWAHAATQANLSLLRQRGVSVIEPTSGELASHLEGKGRMEEPERIAEIVLAALANRSSAAAQQQEYPSTSPAALPADQSLLGKRILLTAGPTHERIDPVRFIGNYSSGKMGLALAEECARRGAQVELVCGPIQRSTSMAGIHTTSVQSAQQMWEAATRLFPLSDAAILCAAVADFTPSSVAGQKIKREGDDLVLRLKPTKDIAQSLGQMKRPDQRLVGFALETNDEIPHAQQKLHKKNLDFIVLNSMNDEGAGFQHDTNKVTIISETEVLPGTLKSKVEVARDIVDKLVSIL
ncbi:MAG: bifunctional phosphopantothenoylcysteine decarboxylase/phosphopantothenate--cysteine ligase CoaBC [Bacteroidaceae bacterium]|nr:bifunctional phosphopantothenoylcysteine decarboxylase/phosphopantothenate--cysteine ligase CoaBC [Bacteroidaceae bacterium]